MNQNLSSGLFCAAVVALGLASQSACSDVKSVPAVDGLEITIAPLTLSDVEEVTYGLRVLSATGVVWTQTGLTSSRYGDGRGALTYIGPCDASPGANPHTVELTIEEVRAGGRALLDPRDWINPAPATRPIRRTGVTCVANSDVLVAFDVTVLRSAEQGFFDIGVEFDDIFCSAKLDCKDQLLHNPGTDKRDATVVVAFACTAGGNEETFLYLSDLVLTCDDGNNATAPVVFTMSAADLAGGQKGPVPSGTDGVLEGGVYEWAVYQGDEQLTSAGVPIEKCFWNRAFGLDRTVLRGQTCRLTALGTATDTNQLTPLDLGTLSANGAYPILTWDVEVLDADGNLCDANPLNASGSGVRTEYATNDTDFETLAPLSGRVACGGEPLTVSCPATADAPIVATQVREGVVSVSAGSLATTVTLPPGYELGTTCCVDACCNVIGD